MASEGEQMSIEKRWVLICDNCDEEEEIDSEKSKLPKGWKKEYNSKVYQIIFGHLCPDCSETIKSAEKEDS
jgi:phage terminase large subunit GpA-like protein